MPSQLQEQAPRCRGSALRPLPRPAPSAGAAAGASAGRLNTTPRPPPQKAAPSALPPRVRSPALLGFLFAPDPSSPPRFQPHSDAAIPQPPAGCGMRAGGVWYFPKEEMMGQPNDTITVRRADLAAAAERLAGRVADASDAAVEAALWQWFQHATAALVDDGDTLATRDQQRLSAPCLRRRVGAGGAAMSITTAPPRGRAGGCALVAKYGAEHMRALGQKGGRTTAERHGRAHMQAIGRKGFAVTVERHFGGDRELAINTLIHRGLMAIDPFPQNGAWTTPRRSPTATPRRRSTTKRSSNDRASNNGASRGSANRPAARTTPSAHPPDAVRAEPDATKPVRSYPMTTMCDTATDVLTAGAAVLVHDPRPRSASPRRGLR